ncbi:MAG: prephenate/arogenate dehydrogenase family protein [Hyphomicrobiaceae bacterium]|nr:prephenate/arogenate dehydrogenase family protein [Hyphomicrobiaceae bacterium]
MSAPIFNRIALIGLGLIGSSIARGVRACGAATEIVGTARSTATRGRVVELGILDQVFDTPGEAVKGADLVVICVPVRTTSAIAEAIASDLAPGAIVTDVGSVKQSVIRDVEPHIPDGCVFVGGHPVAGTEFSGPDAGFAELFYDRWCILTPSEKSTPDAVKKLSAFWQALGSNVETMAPDHHDLVLAITSHIPHLIAYNIVGTVADLETDTRSEVIQYSASGFRDFTRIAASDPTMWRDIFLANRDAVLEMLGRFSEDLSTLQRAIRRGEGEKLFELFDRTRNIRRNIIEAGQETAEADFGRGHTISSGED